MKQKSQIKLIFGARAMAINMKTQTKRVICVRLFKHTKTADDHAIRNKVQQAARDFLIFHFLCCEGNGARNDDSACSVTFT